MALIKCPECNHDVSTFASVCPNCGYPMNRIDKTARKVGVDKDKEPSTAHNCRMQHMVFTYKLMKYLTQNHRNVSVSYELQKPDKSTGTVIVTGKDLIFDNPDWLMKAVEFSSGFETKPNADGTVQMVFTFDELESQNSEEHIGECDVKVDFDKSFLTDNDVKQMLNSICSTHYKPKDSNTNPQGSGGMVYITGDCHADWKRFSNDSFPEQKEMTRDDFVIVCGDFGIWHDDKNERWWFKWFEGKNFTVLFVDGNHENFDRLYSDEFEVVDFHGGKAHKIRENIYHLMRGYVFDLCGKSFFAFGGGSSHDIDDGILDKKDYATTQDLVDDYNKRTKRGELVRINHISWWEQELPSEEEMERGIASLQEHNNTVDYVITHCCPQHIASLLARGKRDKEYNPDILTNYFDRVSEQIQFKKWIFGHYHNNRQLTENYFLLYEQIVRIV